MIGIGVGEVMAVIEGIQADLFPDLGNILYWWARDRYRIDKPFFPAHPPCTLLRRIPRATSKRLMFLVRRAKILC